MTQVPTETPSILSDAISSEWVGSWIGRQNARVSTPAESGFVVTPELVREFGDGIPQEYWSEFTESASRAEMGIVRDQLKSLIATRKRLDEAGWTGTVARIAAGVTDPVALGLGLATGGAGWISQGGRLARYAKAGLLAAGSTAPVSAYIASQDPDQDWRDALYSTAGAFALGSIGHGVGEGIRSWAGKARKAVEFQELLESGQTFTPKALAQYADNLAAATPEGQASARAASVDPPVAPASATRSYLESDLFGMDPEALTALEADLKVREWEPVRRYLGLPDDAPPRRLTDAELVRLDAEIDPATQPELFRAIYGDSADPRVDADTVRSYRVAAQEVQEATPEALADAITQSLFKVGKATDVAAMTPDQRIAAFKIAKAGEWARQQGWNEDAIARMAVQKAASQFTDPADAEVVLERLIRPVPATPGDEELTALRQIAGERDIEVWNPPDGSVPARGEVEVQIPGQKPAGGDGGSGGGEGPPGGGNATAGDLPPGGGKLSTVVRGPNDFVAEPTDTMAGLRQMRFGVAGRLGSSEIKEVREVASVYAQDWLLRKGAQPPPDAASTYITREMGRIYGGANRDAAPIIRQYMQRNAVPVAQQFGQERRLYQEAGAAITDDRIYAAASPEVKALADKHRAVYAELGSLAQRHGVAGFEDFKTNANYLPRFWNIGKVYEKLGDGWDLAGLIEQGMVKSGWEPARAAKVAPGFLKAIKSVGQLSDIDKQSMFGANAAAMRSILRNYVKGITDQEIEDLIRAVTPEGVGTPRAKSRTALDPFVKLTRTNADGQAEDLWLYSLFETDANAILGKYTRQILGASAEAEILRAMSLRMDPTGTKVLRSWDELRQEIIDRFGAANIRTDTGVGLRTMRRLDAIRKSVVGIPLNDPSALADLSRLVRSYNFLRVGPAFGLAQIPEFSKVMAEYGADAMRSWPQLRQVFRRAQDWQLSDDLLEELENFVAAGTDRLAHQVTARFDDVAGMEEFGGGAVETLLRRGERFVGDLSLMAPITSMQQRWAAASVSHKLLRGALGLTDIPPNRIRELGLTDEMWGRIVAQVKEHATTERGMLGTRLKVWNFDDWTDTQAAGRLISAIHRSTALAIQQSDIGAMPLIATSPLGRLAFQFRSFMTQAYEKQFLRGVQQHDRRAVMSALATGFTGALIYMAQKYIRSIGDSEARKRLSDDLSPANVALQGFARSGVSSFLPSAIDTGMWFAGQEPLFNSRYSGLSSRGLMMNPTFDLFDQTAKAGQGVVGGLTGQGVTRTQGRAMTNILPFNQMLGVRQGLDAMTDGLPTKAGGSGRW